MHFWFYQFESIFLAVNIFSLIILPSLLFQKLIMIHAQLQIAHKVCRMIFQHFPKIRNIQLVKNVS